MAEYVPKPQVFIKKGMSVSLPGDRLSTEYFQYVENVRSFKLGEWRQRPGMSVLYPSIGFPVRFLDRIDNNLDDTFRRIVGADNVGTGEIYVDDAAHTALNLVDTGYSPDHFSSIVSRPDRSPLPYKFIANSLRNSKISSTGARTEWGISAPTQAPTVEPQGANYLAIANLNSTAGWVLSVGALSAPAAVPTILSVLYDSGLTGMACFITSGAANLSYPVNGQVIEITTGGSTEVCITHEVNFAVAPLIGTSGATISSIMYDSGTTGLCTITFVGVSSGIERNSVLRLNDGGGNAEYVRILSITNSLDGTPSARCSTVNTHVAGELVNGATSVRIFTNNNHGVGSTCAVFFFSAAYTAVAGDTVTLSRSGIDINTTQASTSSGGSPTTRPLKSDDVLHFSLQTLFNAVEEIQIQLDVGDTGLTQDYYYIVIRQPDLIGSVTLSQASILAQQLEFARRNLDTSIKDQEFGLPPPPSIGDLGNVTDSLQDNEYFGLPVLGDIVPSGSPLTVSSEQFQGRADIQVPLSAFQRIGTGSGTLRNVKNVRIIVKYNNTASSGFNLTAFNFYGSYEPTTLERPNYSYVYRWRNSSTGTRSNPSPSNRAPTESIRRRLNVTVPSSPDPQVDVVDIYRIGGILTQYHLVGTLTGGVTTFEDNTSDSVALRNPQLEVGRFKPWVTYDVPKSGVLNVTGTSVTQVSGDTFDTGWVKGTQVIIKDRTYSLYTNPTSTTRLELNESAGEGTNLTYQIIEPTLDGIPYPSVFGPYAGSSAEFIFAVGDVRNPGFLYFSNGDDPESASGLFIELCPPSEKLISGVVLDGIPFCFSDKRSWRILPSFEGGQTGAGAPFYPQETAMGKGLVARAGICVGDSIYFVSYDGIYRSRGDAVESLTDDSLKPLFDVDGTFITDFVVPVSPVDIESPDDISLIYSMDGLYFSYKGRDASYYTFFRSQFTQGWMLDSVTTGSITRSLRELQSENADNVVVGTNEGRVLIRDNSVFLDGVDVISGRIWDREEIWDTLRYTKQVGDSMLDIDPAGATITPTMRYENNTSSDVLTTITGSGRDQFVRDINAGSGRIVRGAAVDLTWNNAISGSPKFYAWEPSGLVKAEESVNRATDWDAGGYTGTKWLQGFRLKGDTLGLAKSFQVEIDGGTFVESFTFVANGEQVVTFWLNVPVVCHEMRMRGADSDLWRNMGVEWIFEPEPERASVWETQATSLDLPFYSHIREMMIAHRSTTDITMTVTSDGVPLSYTIPNGADDRVRSYVVQQAVKAKYRSFRFESSEPFGLWIADIEVKAGEWGRTESYRTIKPFGDLSRSNGGARI